jgi:hypothetical protein
MSILETGFVSFEVQTEVLYKVYNMHQRSSDSATCKYCKDFPKTGHEGPQGEKRYSSTLSLTSVLDGDVYALAALPAGKETR